MQKVIYTPAAINKLQELLEILYIKEYVGFRDTAEEYVKDIFAFTALLPNSRRNLTINSSLGKWYSTYKRNNHTT